MKMRNVGVVRIEKKERDDGEIRGRRHIDVMEVNYYLHQCPECGTVDISSNEVMLCPKCE